MDAETEVKKQETKSHMNSLLHKYKIFRFPKIIFTR